VKKRIFTWVFSERVYSRSRSLYARPIARPSVCRLSSVTLVRPTEAVEIFGNISTAFETMEIVSGEPLRRAS